MRTARHIHFIGIGGIGISALARKALADGVKVTGSDGVESAMTEALRRLGAEVYAGHRTDHITDSVDLAIYTEAIDKASNPEYLRLKKLGVPVLSYFEALGQLTAQQKTIAVIGTHGKTTTTAMLGLAMERAGLDPTVVVGSRVKEFGDSNLRQGQGEWLVAEACEYRRSFLHLQPFGVVFLNCEAEHLDYYKNEADYVSAFSEFVAKIPADGFLVVNGSDQNALKAAESCKGRVIEVREPMELELNVPGDFNRLNATLAYRAGVLAGGAEEPVSQGLKAFSGTWRRLEVKGEVNGATVIDDYGHHPTEIRVTLKAIKQKYPGHEVVCVFQPHQHSRAKYLLEEFKGAFGEANKVFVSDIYAVRDSREDIGAISGEQFAGQLNHPDASYTGGLKETEAAARNACKPGQVVVVMGAGSIGKVAEGLVSNF